MILINGAINDKDFEGFVNTLDDAEITVAEKYKSVTSGCDTWIFADEEFETDVIPEGYQAYKKTDVPLKEGVDVINKHYVTSHGKAPAGKGGWIFGIGSRDRKDWFSFSGSYAEGRKKAIDKASKKGATKVYVMESVAAKGYDVGYVVEGEGNQWRVNLMADGQQLASSIALTESAAISQGQQLTAEFLSNFKG